MIENLVSHIIPQPGTHPGAHTQRSSQGEDARKTSRTSKREEGFCKKEKIRVYSQGSSEKTEFRYSTREI